MSLEEVLGQEYATRTALTWLRTDRLPHTILISGPEGSGKRELAMELVRAILCRGRGVDACGSCGSCRKVTAAVHPDVHLLVPMMGGKKGKDDDALQAEMRQAVSAFLAGAHVVSSTAANISREHLRLLQRQMVYAPSEGRRRVAVILDAERMHPSGANALLKVLEEPPAKSVFLLVSSAAELILPTIRSRTQCLMLRRLQPQHVRSRLMQEGYPPARVALGVRLGGGNLHRARAAARGDLEPMFERVERLLRGAVAGDDSAYWELVEEFGARDSRPQLEQLIALCSVYLRDIFLAANGWVAGQVLTDRKEILSQLGRALAQEQIQAAGAELDRAVELLTRNVSPSLVLAGFWRCLRGGFASCGLPGKGRPSHLQEYRED